MSIAVVIVGFIFYNTSLRVRKFVDGIGNTNSDPRGSCGTGYFFAKVDTVGL
jgi:hypothetical protein